jgi:hypothetical protein
MWPGSGLAVKTMRMLDLGRTWDGSGGVVVPRRVTTR